VWLALIAATCLSFWLGGGHRAPVRETAVSVAVLAVAFVKVRLVGLYFMELKNAPVVLRAIFESYVVAVAGIVLTLYLAA
jgi:heme/copper-type cytochrome/quinol oxidase subunit 4